MKQLSALAITFFCSLSLFSQDIYFPPLDNHAWETMDPDSLRWSQSKINALYDYLEFQQTRSFILLKDGRIVLEKYFGTFTQDSLWVWFSAGKSFRSMLVGIAQSEGKLNIDQKSSDILGKGWSGLSEAQEEQVSIWHHLTMTTGLDEAAFSCITPACLTYRADAGSRWAYHNGPYNLLKDILEISTGETINQLSRRMIMNKIGMQTGFWLRSGNNTFFFSSPRDMARFGLLTMAGGKWGEEEVLPDTAYFRQMVNSSQELNPAYGYLWWLNGKSSFVGTGSSQQFEGSISPAAPSDVILAAGARGQFVSISPSQGLVMIRQGWTNENSLAPMALHNNIWQLINELGELSTSSLADLNSAIHILPNPVNDFIIFKHPSMNSLPMIHLSTLSGKLIKQQNHWDPMNIQSLARGIYLLHIHIDGQSVFKKVIKL